jgi:glutathione S-transferase
MLLIGRNLSPYSRRVAIAMTMLNVPHDREYLSVTANPERGLEVNPVGRVPVLILDDGERLTESSAILDYLMELVGPAKSLIPPHGKPRRDCLQLMAVACGTLDKAVAAIYEQRRRPPEKVHEPWRLHLLTQVAGGLKALEERAAELPEGSNITLGVMVSFLGVYLPDTIPAGRYPALMRLRERCEALPAFQAHPLEQP